MSVERWRAFFICNSVTRPFVHFFPHSSASTAPYPILATISIFGGGLKPASVTLEGARLSQPDGVRLDAVFTELSRGAQGLVGVEVELQPRQRRIDLSASQVVIELVQGRSSTRFFATPVEESSAGSIKPLAAMANDSLQATVVAVNSGMRSVTAAIKDAGSDQGRKEVPIDAQSVQEIALASSPVAGSPGAFTLGTVVEDTAETGVAVAAEDVALESARKSSMPVTAPVLKNCSIVSSSEDTGVSFFALYRDAKSKAPVSVMAL